MSPEEREALGDWWDSDWPDTAGGALAALGDVVDQIAEARVRAALEAVGTAVGSLLQPNPINGDCSNYTLNRLLQLIDRQAGGEFPTRAAVAEEKRRADESWRRMQEINAEIAATPPRPST